MTTRWGCTLAPRRCSIRSFGPSPAERKEQERVPQIEPPPVDHLVPAGRIDWVGRKEADLRRGIYEIPDVSLRKNLYRALIHRIEPNGGKYRLVPVVGRKQEIPAGRQDSRGLAQEGGQIHPMLDDGQTGDESEPAGRVARPLDVLARVLDRRAPKRPREREVAAM